MKKTATINEISSATGKPRRTIARILAGLNNSSFVWKRGKTGREKHYFINQLPDDLRVALARNKAKSKTVRSSGQSSQSGAEAAKQLLKDEAEAKEKALIAKETGLAKFEELPAKKKAEANARFSFIQACEGFLLATGIKPKRGAKRSKKAILQFAQEYNAGRIVLDESVRDFIGPKTNYSTLHRTFEKYDKYGLAGLANGWHNPNRGSTALTEEQQDKVLSTMLDSPTTSIKNIRRALQGRFGMEVPSTGVISRFRQRWIKENQDLWMFNTNPDEWKNKHMFAFGSASEYVERLNQLWEADSTPADLMLVDGRYSLIGMVDVFTRRLKLVVSKTSRAASVTALIRRCILDWGVPEIIKTDNGKDYVSNHVVRVLGGLEIEQKLCTPFQGQEKPHVERVFKTFLHQLVELKPNFIGHNVAERKAIEARRSFAERVMNKKSNPIDMGVTAKELQAFCDEWVEVAYHQDPHAGIDGQTPMEMLRKWSEPVRRIRDERALDMLLMEAPRDGGIRTIKKKGIQVNNKLFQAKEFAGKVGDKCFVLLDPIDIGTVYVYLVNQYGEMSFLCPAIDPIWTGIDRAEFSVSSRKHQTKLMRKGRKDLVKRTKAEGDREAYDYLSQRKKQIENIVEFPEKSEDYITRGLDEAAKAVDAAKAMATGQKEKEIQAADLLISVPDPSLEATPKDSNMVKLITCETDIYHKICAETTAEMRKLTDWEYKFLGDFYANEGRSYLILEGDLREKIGVADDAQAKL